MNHVSRKVEVGSLSNLPISHIYIVDPVAYAVMWVMVITCSLSGYLELPGNVLLPGIETNVQSDERLAEEAQPCITVLWGERGEKGKGGEGRDGGREGWEGESEKAGVREGGEDGREGESEKAGVKEGGRVEERERRGSKGKCEWREVKKLGGNVEI